MTTETITDAFEDAAAEKLLAEAQTEMEGQGFEKPVKTRRQLAEEFLEHFQGDVEKAETALGNARTKLRLAVELRDDAEENLRRAIREENGDGDITVADVAGVILEAAADAGLTVTPAERDELLPEAVRVVVATGAASVNLLQRRLKCGYERAGKILDQLEAIGVVECPDAGDGTRARTVLVDDAGMDAVLARLEPQA